MRSNFSSSGALLHPAALTAIAVLVINDHVLKGTAPGWLTGRLSDAAGLAYFPLLLHAFGERFVYQCWRRPSYDRWLPLACAMTAGAFALINTWGAAAEFYRIAVGTLQWPFHAGWDLVVSGAALAPPVRPVSFVMDPTDLIALPSVLIALAIARDAARSSGPVPARQKIPLESTAARSRASVIAVAALCSIATSYVDSVSANAEAPPFELAPERPSRTLLVMATASPAAQAAYVVPSIETPAGLANELRVVLRLEASANGATVRAGFAEQPDSGRENVVSPDSVSYVTLVAAPAFTACIARAPCQAGRTVRIDLISGAAVQIDLRAEARLRWPGRRPPAGATIELAIAEGRAD